MGPSIVCLSILAALASSEAVRGVPKSKLPLYVSKDGSFRCLDGSQTIPFERVNDDYCDCQDGSDEPGTSACPNGTFFCQNAGHIPAYLPTSRVNDGVCEEACCDGSDEWLGLKKCPNVCKEQAKAHAAAEAEKESVRASGWKVKEQWIKKAHKIRLEIEDELQRLEVKLSALRVNLKDKESAIEKLQLEGGGIDQGSQSQGPNDIEMAILKYKGAINVLQDRVDEQRRRIDNLQNIMTNLAGSYNPNFQDMAVKGAVTAFNELAALSEPKISDSDLAELLQMNLDMKPAVCPNPSTASPGSSLWSTIKGRLAEMGVLQSAQSGGSEGASTPGESKQLSDAKSTADGIREEIVKHEGLIESVKSTLSTPLGPHDVYRAVDGDCFSSLISDYTYEVCLLRTLHQKSATGGDTIVGRFDRVDAETGSLYYSHGAKCWNGPERSGRVDVECGAVNELLSVREAQKCEYVFRIKSPLGCSAPKRMEAANQQGRDEL